MKQFRKLLAIALVGVMAVMMLAGCSTPIDPDTVFENDTVCAAYDSLTNKASDAGYSSGVTYSRKLSTVAKSMYQAVKVSYGIEGEYSADCDNAAQAAFAKAKKDGTIPANAVLCVGYLPTNPQSYGGFNYSAVYEDSEYGTANTVGICYADGKLMIVAAYIPSK